MSENSTLRGRLKITPGAGVGLDRRGVLELTHFDTKIAYRTGNVKGEEMLWELKRRGIAGRGGDLKGSVARQKANILRLRGGEGKMRSGSAGTIGLRNRTTRTRSCVSLCRRLWKRGSGKLDRCKDC